jgi:hypothetical protein
MEDDNWWMLRFSNNVWHITNAQRKNSGKTGGLMFSTKVGAPDPCQAGPWRVFAGKNWEDQDSVVITQVGAPPATSSRAIAAPAISESLDRPRSAGATSETNSTVDPREKVDRIERDGCMFWEVLLKKETAEDKFGFVQANGKLDFEQRLMAAAEEAGAASPTATTTPPSTPAASTRPDIAILNGPEVLVVRKINEGGLLHRYNLRHPEAEVLTTDFICNVNGQTSIEGMQREIRSRRIHLQIMRYPESFTVPLQKNGRKLGFKFDKIRPNSTYLRISEILPDGALPEWNKQQVNASRWHLAVLPDMMISTVSNVTGDSQQLVNELKTAEELTLYVQRGDTKKGAEKA